MGHEPIKLISPLLALFALKDEDGDRLGPFASWRSWTCSVVTNSAGSHEGPAMSRSVGPAGPVGAEGRGWGPPGTHRFPALQDQVGRDSMRGPLRAL